MTSSQHAVVLVVDDEAMVRRVLATALRREQYTVLEAASRAEAWSQVRALEPAEPALVLTDVHMSQLSGIELVRDLRSHGLVCPVLAMSSDRRSEAAVLAAGANGFLAKPFGLDLLVNTIADLLRDAENSSQN